MLEIVKLTLIEKATIIECPNGILYLGSKKCNVTQEDKIPYFKMHAREVENGIIIKEGFGLVGLKKSYRIFNVILVNLEIPDHVDPLFLFMWTHHSCHGDPPFSTILFSRRLGD